MTIADEVDWSTNIEPMKVSVWATLHLSSPDVELHDFVRHQMPYASFVPLADLLGMEEKKLDRCLGVSSSTLLRRARSGHFSSRESRCLYALVPVVAVALNQFDGSVMLVSHDRALLRSVCDEFWLVGRGQVVPFDGDLEDYQRYLVDESKRVLDEARRDEASNGTIHETKRQASAQIKRQSEKRLKEIERELKTNEQSTSKMRDEKSRYEKLLVDSFDIKEILETSRLLPIVDTVIQELEDQWLQLHNEADELKSEVVKVEPAQL